MGGFVGPAIRHQAQASEVSDETTGAPRLSFTQSNRQQNPDRQANHRRGQQQNQNLPQRKRVPVEARLSPK